jgi:hypothetical protein
MEDMPLLPIMLSLKLIALKNGWNGKKASIHYLSIPLSK